MNTEPPNAPQAPRGRPEAAYYRYATSGLQFALTFLAFGAAGWWLDGKLGTGPWLMIGGIVFGAAGAMYSLVRQLSPARTQERGSGARVSPERGSRARPPHDPA